MSRYGDYSISSWGSLIGGYQPPEEQGFGERTESIRYKIDQTQMEHYTQVDRHREQVEKEIKRRYLEMIRRESDLQRRLEEEDESRDRKRMNNNKQNFYRAYERLENQTGVSRKIHEWDQQERELAERRREKKKSRAEQDDRNPNLPIKENSSTLQQSDLEQLSKSLPASSDKLPQTQSKKSTGSSLFKELIANKLERSLNLQIMSSSEEARSSNLSLLPRRSKLDNRRSLPSHTQSLMNPITRKLSIHPTSTSQLGYSHSIDLSSSYEESRRVLLQKQNKLSQRRYLGSKGRGVSTILKLKLSRQNTSPTLVSLSDYQDIECSLRRNQALNENKKFGPGEAWENLQTSYLRLSKKNVGQLERMCFDAGLDVSLHPHSHITHAKRN